MLAPEIQLNAENHQSLKNPSSDDNTSRKNLSLTAVSTTSINNISRNLSFLDRIKFPKYTKRFFFNYYFFKFNFFRKSTIIEKLAEINVSIYYDKEKFKLYLEIKSVR